MTAPYAWAWAEVEPSFSCSPFFLHCVLLQKLYSTKVNANTFKAMVTAQYAGVKVEFAPFEMGVTNKSPEFLKLNPIGKVRLELSPVLDSGFRVQNSGLGV